MSYENPWCYNNQIVESDKIEEFYGFVYRITNLINNKQYIGKKFFWSSKTRTIKKKKKRFKIESDWKNYYGSNKELMYDVDNCGIINFKREIIRLCKSKGECNYFEAKYQFQEEVLENDNYYNSWIMCKIHKAHVKR
jgi:hypothetical protein